MIIKLLQARVGDNGVHHVVQGGLSSVRPKRCNGVGVFILGQLAQRSNAKLKVMNEMGVELGKADEFCHIADKLRGQSSCQKSVLGFGRPVAIYTHVNSNELKMLRKKVAFAKVQ